jgi:peptidoglycan-N-acetylmuramic acid deacetylase
VAPLPSAPALISTVVSSPAPAQAAALPPTATPAATATGTATALPPTTTATGTATALPPTTTATGTATALPPTASATATATRQPPAATTTPPHTPKPPPATATRLSTPTPTSVGPAKSTVPPEIERGNPDRRQIALTFDAGASAEPLPKILAALRQAGIHSTFFLTGNWSKDNPDAVKAIVAAGHELGNHSVTHTDFTTLTDAQIVDELETTEEIVQKIAGRTTKPFFRPPYGARDRRVLAAAWSAGYRSVYWTIDSGDWLEDATVDRVVNKILSNAVNGAVVVEHVGSTQTGDGLPRIIAGLRDKGFDIVPLSRVLSTDR